MYFITENQLLLLPYDFQLQPQLINLQQLLLFWVGFLATLKANFCSVSATPLPKNLKTFSNPSVSIVISEKILDLFFLHILQPPLNKLLSLPFFCQII